MHELKGKLVNIVLTIEEGRGFEVIKQPVFFSANFNGRIMESDEMDTANSVFNTEMVWETEKKFLRSAKSENKPIRLDWFTFESKFIGFALVHPRSAQTFPCSSANLQIFYNWQKLFNVPKEFGARACLEFKYSLTVRDHLVKRFIPPAIPNIIKPDDDGESLQIPITYNDEFIKIGDINEKLQKYHFKILVRLVKNLHVLLPENMVFSQMPKMYHIKFLIFGIEVKTRSVTRDLHDDFPVDETIVINILSNPTILEMYFEKYPTIVVKFNNGDCDLGIAEMAVSTINWSFQYENYRNERVIFEDELVFEGLAVKFGTGIDRRASIEMKCSLEYILEEGQGDLELKSPLVRFSSGTEGGIDLNVHENEITKPGNQKLNKVTSVTYDVVLKKEASKFPSIGEIKAGEKHQYFTVIIIFETIVWSRISSMDFCIKVIHPYGCSRLEIKTKITSSGDKIILDKAVCKLNLLCFHGRLKPILLNLAPKIQIFDAKTGKPLTSEHMVPCQVQENELAKVLTLKSLDHKNIGDLSYCVLFEASDVKCMDKTSPHDLPPTIMDENLIFQTIEELQNWKIQECTKYSAELYCKKNTFLEQFEESLTGKQKLLECLLQTNIERCKKLSYALEMSIHENSLNEKILEREDDAELNFDLAFHKNTVTYALTDNIDLIEKITSLEMEFSILKGIATRTGVDLEKLQQSTLTGDQVNDLLLEMKIMQEQNEDLKNDKGYFKNEWEKAMKEVHELKLELQKYLQEKIAEEKLKLSQLSLDSFAE